MLYNVALVSAIQHSESAINDRTYLVAQMVKNLPAVQETQVQSLGWEYPLEKGMATHSNILAGKCHGQRSLGGYSSRCHKDVDMTATKTTTKLSESK